jgi:hypothetical protein
MNTALIALPRSGKPLLPPLTLAYLATLLEQRRHIVRIYDLALPGMPSLQTTIQQLRGFRPQVVVLAGESTEDLGEATSLLQAETNWTPLPLQIRPDDLDAGWVCASVLQWYERFEAVQSAEAGLTLPIVTGTLDQLPFPARHLLSLEAYDLRAVGGELQTSLLVGGTTSPHSGRLMLRAPAQIVAELRSVSQEFGLRHYLFPSIALSTDRAWLYELLTRLVDARLQVSWETIVDPEQLDEGLIAHMGRAGCELVFFQLDAARVFDTSAARDSLRRTVGYFRQHGIHTRAEVKLEPEYESITRLVDVSTTFGLDDVQFTASTQGTPHGDATTDFAAIARQRYDEGRDRQRYVERFGATLGNLIWRLRGPRSTSPDELEDEQERAV